MLASLVFFMNFLFLESCFYANLMAFMLLLRWNSVKRDWSRASAHSLLHMGLRS